VRLKNTLQLQFCKSQRRDSEERLIKALYLDGELEEKEIVRGYLKFHCLLLSMIVLSSVNFNSSVTLGALPLCLHKMASGEMLGS